MQNEFIEGLREKAKETDGESFRKKLKKEFPWLSDDIVSEKEFENALTRIFKPKGGEER